MRCLIHKVWSFLLTGIVLCAGFFVLVPNFAGATIPSTLGYQGRLTNASGAAQTGTFSFTFRLYSAVSGGVVLWTETQPTVSVDQAAFAVQLGSVTPFPAGVDFTSPLFLTTEVNADGEMSPRVPLNAVPYAYTASGVNASPSNPTSATGGRMFYNTSNGSLYYYDATAASWRNLSNGVSSTLQQITSNGATTTDPIYMYGSLQTLPTSTTAFVTVTSTAIFSTPMDIAVSGRYAYVTNFGNNSLEVVDVSDITEGDEATLITTLGLCAHPHGIAVAGRYAYVACENDNTLKIVDISKPSSLTVASTIAVGTTPTYVAVTGRYAYVTNAGSNTVSIVDVSDATTPSVVTSTLVGTTPTGIFSRGRFVYVVNQGSDTLSTIDVLDPANPVTVSIAVGSQPTDVFVEGRFAIVSLRGSNTIARVDISDPSSPSVLTTNTVGSQPSKLFVAGRYAYVVNEGDDTMSMMDVTQIDEGISLVATIPMGTDPRGVFISGRVAYVLNQGDNTLGMVDINGIETNGLMAHSAELGSLQVNSEAYIDNRLGVGGGINVGTGGIFSAGGLIGQTLGISHNFIIDANGVMQITAQDLPPGTPSATDSMKIYALTDNGTVAIESVDSTGYTQRLNRDISLLARNQTGSTIPRGSAVHISGSFGDTALIILSQANSTTTIPAIGLAAEDIPNLGYGHVIQFGQVSNIDTSAFTVGDELWISPTVAGGLTKTEPTAPNIAQPLATVLTSDAASGTVQVFSRAPSGIGSGTIINSWVIGNGASGTKSLVFDGASNGTLQWNPVATNTITIPDLTGLMAVSTGTLTIGSVPFVTTGGALGEDNANLFWDYSTHKLGIGTNLPSAPLSVVGLSALQGITFTDATGTSATTTNVFAASAIFTNLRVTTPFGLSDLIWTNGTGTNTTSTNLAVTSYARLPSDTMINALSVCLQDGTNCPSGTTPNFQTITNTGNTTTHDIQFAGGTSTGAFTIQHNLTVTGTTDLQALNFINGSGTYLDFSTTTANPAYREGRLFFDDTQEALAYYGETGADPIHIGQEVVVFARNLTGSPILRGQAVRIVGDDGAGLPTLDLARSDLEATVHTVGLANDDIPDGEAGYILTAGDLHGMDTSLFASGDILYLSSATAGALTNVRPPSPSITMEIGVVSKSDATDGRIVVHFITPKFGAITQGGVTFGDSNNFIRDDAAHLYYASATVSFGIGTNAPSSTLYVIGTTTLQALTFTIGTGTSVTTTNLFTTNGNASNFIWTQAVGTYVTSSNLAVSTYARLPTDTKINDVAICLLDGTNCPSGTTSNFQTVTNAGNTTTKDIQFNGGTSTGAFTIHGNLTATGTTDLQGLSFVHGTSTSWFGFATASGTQLMAASSLLVGTSTQDLSSAYLAQIEANVNNQAGLKIANYSSGNAASAVTRYYTDTGLTGSVFATGDAYDLFANASTSFGVAAFGNNNLRLSTNGGYLRLSTDPTNPDPDLVIMGTGAYRGNIGIGTQLPTAKLTVAGGMIATDIVITNSTTTNATTTNFVATTYVRLPSDTLLNNSSICLLDGTNCPSGTTSNFQTVTNAGNTTTRDIQFAGGTSTYAFTIQHNLTVTGTTDLQGLSLVNGTSTSWFGYAVASGTTINAMNAFFVNVTTVNATSTNFFTNGLNFTNGTSTAWLGFVTASGTTLNALTVNATGLVSPNVTITGGTINNTTIGLATAAAAMFTNVTSTSATTTNLFATNGSFINLLAQNATATNISVTGTLSLTNATATILMSTSGTISINDVAGRNLLTMRDLNTNFGAALNAGAFMDRNSSIQQEFNNFRTTITADTAGVAGAGMGDGGGWGAYESGSCQFTTPVDQTNGVLRLDPVTNTADGCLTMLDDAVRNIRGILNATNLPVMLMKMRPSATDALNFIYAGMGDASDGSPTVGPTNFIGFSGTTTWTGLTSSGGTDTLVQCSGQTISTTADALLMVQVRSSTDVRFFVDNDVSNGIQFTECGGGSQTNIPTINLAPEIEYQIRTGGVLGTLDVDFFRAWQDDPAESGENSNTLQSQSTPSDFVSRSGLAQFFPADDPNMAAGTLVSLDTSADVMKVRPTENVSDVNMVGVVTNDPGLVLSNGSFEGVRVVTHGRASAFASLENGPINIGDALTSASVSGTVMRASASGPMIGRALGTASSGTVLLLVEPGFYLPAETQNALFQLDASASGTATGLQAAAPTPEITLPAGTQINEALGVGTLVVRDATFTHSVTVIGTALFRGPVVFGETNAGRVKFDPGQVDVHVTFSEPYPTVPHVFVSPELEDLSNGMGFGHNIWDGGYYLMDVTSTGFGIRLPHGGYCPNIPVDQCPVALWFSWFVVGFEAGSPLTAPTSAPTADAPPPTEIPPTEPDPISSDAATTTTPEITPEPVPEPVVEPPVVIEPVPPPVDAPPATADTPIVETTPPPAEPPPAEPPVTEPPVTP